MPSNGILTPVIWFGRMQFTLRGMMIAIALIAGGVAFYPRTLDPIANLTESGVELSDGTFLNELLQQSGLPIEPSTLNNVLEIRFPRESKPTLEEIRLLTRFPNLKTLYLPCEIPDGAMNVLKDCPKLEHLSLSNSNASDRLLPSISEIRSLKSITIDGSLITDYGIRGFRWPAYQIAK